MDTLFDINYFSLHEYDIKKTIPLLLLEVYILNKPASETFRVSLKVPLSEILMILVNPSPKIVRVESLEFSRVPLNVKYPFACSVWQELNKVKIIIIRLSLFITTKF